jgi:ATP-binding cassette subfamily B protein
MISHKITGLAWADKIVVIDKGEISEQGKHEILVQEKGYYAYLYKKQFLEGWKELNHDS